MATIFHLYYRIMHTGSASHYFFSNIPKIVEFLNHHDQRDGLHWQVVTVIQLDTNKRQAFSIPGYSEPCNTFQIDFTGKMKPLNVLR